MLAHLDLTALSTMPAYVCLKRANLGITPCMNTNKDFAQQDHSVAAAVLTPSQYARHLNRCAYWNTRHPHAGADVSQDMCDTLTGAYSPTNEELGR